MKATLYVPAGTTVEVLDRPTEPTEPTDPGTYTPDAGSYRIWHNGGPAKTGPTCVRFNAGLALRWRNLNGDWFDRNGVEQGSEPWYILTLPTQPAGAPPSPLIVDITSLAEHWRATRNTGALLIVPVAVSAAAWTTFAGSASPTKPTIAVTLADGTQRVLAVDVAGFTMASETAKNPASPTDCSMAVRLSRQGRGLLHCPGIEDIDQPITRAMLSLTVVGGSASYANTIHVMQTDAPPLLIGGAGHAPTMGLAAEVGSEDALIGHPDVFAAGDFREENWNETPGVWTDESLGRGGLMTYTSMKKAQYQKTTCVPDPDHPGRYYLDTCIAAGEVSGGTMHCQIGARADTTDPLRPIIASEVIDEAFCRVEVWIDPDSFWSNFYAFKFSPVGMDLRHGVWDDQYGWNHKGGSAYVFGSGQTKSDGRRSLDPKYNQWLYKGHSIRGHTMGWPHPTSTAYPQAIALGIAPSHLGPYDTLWDGGLYGTEQNLRLYMTEPDGRLRQHCIPKGRWVTMESQTRLNTIDLSAPDAYGNGIARNDGIFRVWLDGVLVGERTDVAWRCHPHIGVKSNWLMQLHGGNTPTDHDIRIRYRNFAIARRYIGPAVPPALA